MKARVCFLLLIVVVLAVPQVKAQSIQVFVGYADNLRPTPFFPIGFGSGLSLSPISSGVTQVFTGGGTFDSGAILIVNTGATPITLNSLSVTVPTWGTNPLGGTTVSTAAGSLWAGFGSITLLPGNGAIFTQTLSFNFDTSDFGATGLNSTNNCNPGNPFAIANPLFCASIAPTVTVTVGGVPMTFKDTGQVLDTGGFDLLNANPCPNPANTTGACNESLQWRPIGTTGISNPGGQVPEPTTAVLLGTGFAALLASKRRRQA